MNQNLLNFINSERNRFEVKNGNMFGLTFSEIIRYSEFLEIIVNRYKASSNTFIENTEAFQKTILTGAHQFTPAQAKLQRKGHSASTELHLEIESFYLFAKILLDKIAAGTEFYFGQARGLSLASHDKFTKDIKKYAGVKDLSLDKNFLGLGKNLKKDISDFRDYQISHLRNPRVLRGTIYHPDGSTKLSVNALYPTGGGEQHDTRALDELLSEIEEYIEVFLRFIEKNKEKTKLTIKSSKQR